MRNARKYPALTERPRANSAPASSRPTMVNSAGGKLTPAGMVWLIAAASMPGIVSRRASVRA
jgi:hypothetical protein